MTDTPPMIAKAREVAAEYRPSMDREIVHSWAGDAATLLRQLAAQVEELGRERDAWKARSAEHHRSVDVMYARALAAEQRVKVLEGALAKVREVIEQGYDGPGKIQKCEHGKYGYEDCMTCYDDALLAALSSGSEGVMAVTLLCYRWINEVSGFRCARVYGHEGPCRPQERHTGSSLEHKVDDVTPANLPPR